MKDLILILVGIAFQAAMLWAFCNIPYKCIGLGYSIFTLIQVCIEYRKNKK